MRQFWKEMDQINFKFWCSVHNLIIYYIPTQYTCYTRYVCIYTWPFYIRLSRTYFDPDWAIIRAIKFKALRMIYDYIFLSLEGISCISSCTRYRGTRHKFLQSVSSTTISCTWRGTWVSLANENVYSYNMSNPLNFIAQMMSQSGSKCVGESII